MSKRIYGSVRNMEDGRGVGGLVVEVYDADLLSDDYLTKTKTDRDGAYSVDIKDWAGFFDKPDVYLIIKTKDGRFLKSTRNDTVQDVVRDTRIDVEVSHFDLYYAGVVADAPKEWKRIVDFVMNDPKYQNFTLQKKGEADPLVKEIQNDLKACVSVLDLFKKYTEELHGNLNNTSPVFKKMDKLFEYGLPYDEMNGHYYGIGIGLITAPVEGRLAEYGNILNHFYSTFQGEDSTWIGKTHWEISQSELDQITGGKAKPAGKAYQGWNHFHRLALNATNPFFYELANFWLNCENPTPYQHEKYHVDKNGAGLVAYATHSIFDKNKKVFRLSYRWPHFNNPFPIRWIFDEMVQVAHGIYLGQLLCATRHLFEAYNPDRPDDEYAYKNWGYFLLVTDDWAPEARRLFTYLDISADADALVPAEGSVDVTQSRFTTLTLEKEPAPYYNDDTFAQVTRDMANRPTVMHLLKEYYSEISKSKVMDIPAFAKLTELFHRGQGVTEINGFYRGVMLGWSSEGFSSHLKKNFLENIWVKSLRTFSPWTGKRFDKITPQTAMDITDGYEKAEVPTFRGANTLSFRNMEEKAMENVSKIFSLRIDRVSEETARDYGYDAQFLYFIARQAKSVDPKCKGKNIFQMNYRWPNLKTIIPDRWCLDEMVQIADGLYLAQLLYATDITRPYDPDTDPDLYKYGFFGYFLLFDEEWHKIRLQIGLDINDA